MNATAAAITAFGVFVLGLFMRRAQAGEPSTPWPTLDVTLLPDTGAPDGAGQNYLSEALDQFATASLPPQTAHKEAQNVAAFLQMIYAAEGTSKPGGYGALFGWPNVPGRSFDPYTVSGHPKQFFEFKDKKGVVNRTSAAGAPQITWTTWTTYLVPFKAWAALNGYSSQGFLPATQDAFAIFLLDIDGALPFVKRGQLTEAVKIARGRWASLPGAGYDQPERSQNFIIAAYQAAGGTIA